MDIKGAVALISGGGSGLGAETARYLSRAGAKVGILDINQEIADYVAKQCNGIAIACDITQVKPTEQALAVIQQQLGVPRICINCAGIRHAQRVVGKSGVMPLEDFSKVINTNVAGTFNLVRLIAQHISLLDPVNNSGERGVIINTSSISGFEASIGQVAYAASKGAINAMTLPLARELAKFGIRVNAIAPGVFATPAIVNMSEQQQKTLLDSIPFPKRLGDPEEFAKLVLQIIDNQMLNGAVLRLDGAMRLR